jgi:sugar/nucleoside kinase (ribokinase family)
VILVAGEALFDLVVSFDGSIEAHPGGAPFNVCCTIARLEREAAFLGALSDDRFGTTLGGALATEGVDLSAVVHVTLPTTIALADLDVTGAATYHFYADGTSAPAVGEAAAASAHWVSSSNHLQPPRRRSSTASTTMCSSCSTRTAGPPSRPTAAATSRPSPTVRAEPT